MSERSGIKEKGKLFYTVSPARGGKSTVCNKMAKAGFVVLGGDDFRLALHGREYAKEAEGFIPAIIDVCAKALLGRGYNVVIDETCTTETTLLRYLRIDKEAEPIFIDTSEEVCIQRAIDTGKNSLIPVIKRHCKQLKELRANWSETVERLKKSLTD